MRVDLGSTGCEFESHLGYIYQLIYKMHLYVRVILLWIILWGIPYISLKIQWKLYKANGGHIIYEYWKEDKTTYEIFIAIFSIGLMLIGLAALVFFLLWFFPEFKEFGQ